MIQRKLSQPQIENDGGRVTTATDELIRISSGADGRLTVTVVPFWTDKSGHVQEMQSRQQAILLKEVPAAATAAILEAFDAARSAIAAKQADVQAAREAVAEFEGKKPDDVMNEKQRAKIAFDYDQAKLDLRVLEQELQSLKSGQE